MKRFSQSVILIAAMGALSGTGLFADDLALEKLPDGIALSVNGERIALQVASAHAFCLHMDAEAPAASAKSLFLNGQGRPAGAPYKVVHDGTTIGIATDFGQLLVDLDKRSWSLRDAAGTVLADWALLGEHAPMPPSQPAMFRLSMGAPATTLPPRYYGSGNAPDQGALTQREGTAKLGNGRSVLPQFWCTAGYGALLVGAHDDAPGAWKADASGHVNWEVAGSGADLYLCPARNLYEWLRDDAELTGFAPVPARWTFGYLQSQWGWKDRAYIDDTLAHFRRDRLPVDAFIVDFEWYTTYPDYRVKTEGDAAFKDFDWNPELFPDPTAQIAGFARQGLHLVGIRKPRLGNSENLAMARGKNWTMDQTRDLDFSNPAVREWWNENNRPFADAGMAAFWNDEGEHRYTEYGYWNIAEMALFQQARPGQRFWSLNRAFHPGMQRFGAAVWTGDIHADWKTFARTPGEMLSYSLAGMPYSACDIGGYSGETQPELLTRWMQAGVFFPVMRAHSEHGMTPHFPWLFGPEAEAAIRQALELRYRLIPYYYSLSHANNVTAAPLMRPLAMEFPDDEKAAVLTDEWLMGRGLLAAPVINEGGARSVYLPGDRWYDFGSTHVTEGPQTIQRTAKLDEIPVYVRAGTLLPLGPVLQYTGEPSPTPLEMQIYPGHDAAFDFVEDDGATQTNPRDGARTTSFSWNEQTRTLSWKVIGNYQGGNVFKTVKAVLFSPGGPVEKEGSLGADGSVNFP